ncbi:outer membrane beta-barrel protein [Mucilaginibacter sp. UC70_90]
MQFIDDYGTQANRTGIKSGDPVKAINITTKKEKSVGNVAQVAAGEGTNGRYNDRLFAQHLNGNQQIGLIGNLTNTINKVSGYGNDNTNDSRSGASTGSLSSNNGSGGNSTLGNLAFTYRDQPAKNLQVNLNYFYTRKILNNLVQSEAQQLNTSSPLLTSSQSMIKNSSDDHSLNIEFEYTPDAKNYFLFTPVFNYSQYDNLSGNNITQTGLINQLVKSNPDNGYSKPLGTADLYWQHLFNKSGRNFSIEAGYLQSTENFKNLQSDRINYLTPKGEFIRDSIVQREIFKKSNNKTVSATLQYIEPLNKNVNVQIQWQTTFKQFDNLFETSNGINTASPLIDSLTSRFGYRFLQNQVSFSYQYMTKAVNLSVGLGLLTAALKGPQSHVNTSLNNKGLYIVPIFRFQYKWSAQQNASINYSSSVREPDFTQLQPVPDYSNAINTVFGNPDLKPALSHRIAADYFNYLPNQRINIALNVNATMVRNQVVSDVSQTYLAEQGSYLNQTNFRNLNGNYTINSNLTTSKQINHAISLEYNAAMNYGHFNALNNHEISAIENWHIIQRFGPKIVPDEHIQIYPFFAYDIFKLNNSHQETSGYNDLKTASLNLQGNFNIVQRWFTNINVSKNYTSGLNTAYKNPFLLNLSVERELFANHNGRLKLQTFDLLNQNNYINRVITANSITDISSTALTRYFMLSLVMNFQKWGGTVSRNGKELKRRGDGSFIYP